MTYPSFDCLDRNTSLNRHWLIEASAGTGKTFSIQHIVTRLLLPPYSLPIEKILVVTFTRASTKELKKRIHGSINEAIQALEGSSKPPDYLLSFIEKGNESIQQAKFLLEQALIFFTEAQIFTIHSFCERMLRETENSYLTTNHEDSELTTAEIHTIVRDYLRSKVDPEFMDEILLATLIKKHRNSADELENEIVYLLKRKIEIPNPSSLKEISHQLSNIIQNRIQEGYCKDTVQEDLIQLAPLFTKTCNRKKELKDEVYQEIILFSNLFQSNSDPSLVKKILQCETLINKTFTDSRKKKNFSPPKTLHHRTILDSIRTDFAPFLHQLSHPLHLLLRIAYGCQKELDIYQNKKGKFTPDDLLLTIQKNMNSSTFQNQVRSKYSTVIIDEFQDTDPLQWKLFSDLFFKSSIPSIFVGDPKQSIYSFRDADLYTYLNAVNTLGENSLASLSTNYRSEPNLVDALNTIFNPKYIPNLFPVPKKGGSINISAVSSGLDSSTTLDSHIEFFLIQGEKGRSKRWPTENIEQQCFEWFANQIMALKKQGIQLIQWAALVKDRYQAKRLSQYLSSVDIPSFTQKQTALTETAAIESIKDLLISAIHPQDKQAITKALVTPVIGFTDEDLQNQDPLTLHLQFYQLHHTLFSKGIAAFTNQLLSMTWKNRPCLEILLQREDGSLLYHSLLQVTEILSEEQINRHLSPWNLLNFIDQIDEMEKQHDPRIYLRQDPSKDAVQILTIHMSKGLEFDYVFPLGLMHRTPQKEALFSMQKNGSRMLQVMTKESPNWKLQMDEIDAEKMRQLYVALTRAKKKIFLPVAIPTDDNQREPGHFSPLELYLQSMKKGWGQNLEEEGLNLLKKWIDQVGSKHFICYSTNTSPLQKEEFHQNSDQLNPPKEISFSFPDNELLSFSSLTRNLNSTIHSDLCPPKDYAPPTLTAHTLPAGAETGNILHILLEKLSFESVKNMETIDPFIKKIETLTQHTTLSTFSHCIAHLLWDLLKNPILLKKTTLTLCEINECSVYKEMEFQYPKNNLDLPIQETDSLQGFIDCIVEWENKYYLIDWKSNWLGPDDSYYTKSHLRQSMINHHYFLQAKIYKESLRRYLELVEQRPFIDCFGGILYIFLRGKKAYEITEDDLKEFKE